MFEELYFLQLYSMIGLQAAGFPKPALLGRSYRLSSPLLFAI